MKKVILVIINCFFFEFTFAKISSVITYEKPKGRLGDQLFCYCKAKWISYTYNIPLYYKTFEYADRLVLSQIDRIYNNEELCHLKQQRLKGYRADFEYIYIECNFKDKNTLYIIDQCFYPEIWKSLIEDIRKKTIHPYIINYNSTFIEKGVINQKPRHDEMIMVFKKDKKFIEELKRLIKPLNKLTEIKKPQNLISVAVHVRKGGGFDKPYKSIQEYTTELEVQRYNDFMKDVTFSYAMLNIFRDINSVILPKNYSIFKEKFIDIAQPLKHPPDQFYIDQIKGLSAMLDNVPLFVYLFTDDKDPLNIMQRFEKAVNNSNIIFACRETANNYYSNVLDDLFAMSTFDCLIRPYSSLSQMAELLGSHKIIISPRHGIWHDDKLIIDEVLITINDNKFQKDLRTKTKSK